MDDKTKLLNCLNFCRSELQNEMQRKLDKTLDYSKIELLQKIIKILGCKYVKREGESCTLNNNCTYPNCK